MTQPFGLIALDLDHTLLQDDGTISPYTKAVLTRCKNAGIAITLATGRMYCSALPFAQQLQLDIPLITYQGALVKYVDGRTISHYPLANDLARDVIACLQAMHMPINLYERDQLYLTHFNELTLRYAENIKVKPLPWPDDLSHTNPTKLVVLAEPEAIQTSMMILTEQFGSQINLTRSSETFLEISHPLATKGTALNQMIQRLGITKEQVIAIGDNYNDMDMIEWAGCGVAMGNAIPPLKPLADFVTEDNNHDGVGKALARLVLGE